jgi:hypothetical protein
MCTLEAPVPSCWLSLISRLHHAKNSFSIRSESDVTNSRYLLSKSSRVTSVQRFTITTGRPSNTLSRVLDRTTGKDPSSRTSHVRYVSRPCPHGHATNLYCMASRAHFSQEIFRPVDMMCVSVVSVSTFSKCSCAVVSLEFGHYPKQDHRGLYCQFENTDASGSGEVIVRVT